MPDIEVVIVNELDIATVRQYATRQAKRLGFSSAKAYRVATAVSELAHNLHLHAFPGGVMHIGRIQDGERVGLEISARDQGPGIADVDLAMRDGYSTNRGLGAGLPGARRLMDEFTIESELGVGTRIVTRMWRT